MYVAYIYSISFVLLARHKITHIISPCFHSISKLIIMRNIQQFLLKDIEYFSIHPIPLPLFACLHRNAALLPHLHVFIYSASFSITFMVIGIHTIAWNGIHVHILSQCVRRKIILINNMNDALHDTLLRMKQAKLLKFVYLFFSD